MAINNITVIGAGQMGRGIAQVASVSGLKVKLMDQSDSIVNKALEKMQVSLTKLVSKNKLTEDKIQAFNNNLLITTDLKSACQEADLVIEAIIENIDIKKELFSKFDEFCPPNTILASNTSSLPITDIASVTKRPDKVIGMHFMNPVPMMKLVEIIRGLRTADEVYEEVKSLSTQMGKVPVEVKDFPGFISNRILMPMINEAIFCLYEGVSDKESIDTVMKLGMNHPMGPLSLADLIGLDTCLYIMETLYDGFSDSKYRPCPLLKQYVKAGLLGKKVGEGFYKYS